MRHEFSGEVQCSDALFCKEADASARARAHGAACAALCCRCKRQDRTSLAPPSSPFLPPSCLRLCCTSSHRRVSPLVLFRSLSRTLLAPPPPLCPPPLLPSHVVSFYDAIGSFILAGCLYIVLAHIYMNIHIYIYVYIYTYSMRADSVRPLHGTQQVQKGDTPSTNGARVGARERESEREERWEEVEGLRGRYRARLCACGRKSSN